MPERFRQSRLAAAFVIVLLPQCSCGGEASLPLPRQVQESVLQVGVLQPRSLTESSGLAPCRSRADVFWTHNDGQKKVRPVLFAVRADGSGVAEYEVHGARLHDWEDLASDHQGRLYLADIGNNDKKRTEVAVHVVAEPDPVDGGSGLVRIERSYRLTYPGKPFDAESLFVDGGSGYVISKVFDDQRAEVLRFALAGGPEPQQLQPVARLDVTSPVTGASLSADHRRLALVAHRGAAVLPFDGDAARLALQRPQWTRFADHHIEGCCFVADGLLATSETREVWLFTAPPFLPAR